MKYNVQIDIDCEGRAFDELGGSFEVARLLRHLVNELYYDRAPLFSLDDRVLVDINGNRCGKVRVTELHNDG